MYAAHEDAPSIHVTRVARGAGGAHRRSARDRDCARRAAARCAPSAPGRGLPQGRPLTELVVDADDAATRATLEAMTQSLAAAARARSDPLRPGRDRDADSPGVRIDIVPEEKAEASPTGR